MGMSVTPTGVACGAVVSGIDLRGGPSEAEAAALRTHWLEHKVLVFPDQRLGNADLEAFTLAFGGFGEDPFFDPIEGHSNIAAIERLADETTPIFAGFFHSDWSFLEVPPAGTCLYGIEIPPVGGDTLFADQVAAYEGLPDELRDKADRLTAIHSAALGYAPDGAYGEADQDAGRSMKIVTSERAYERRSHPFVRTHPETGERALYSSPAYIVGFEELDEQESRLTLMEFYREQTRDEYVYAHKWEPNMLVVWDNRSTLHSATGGYDGHHRLLHRTTIADMRF